MSAGLGIGRLFKMHLSCQLDEQFENHGLIYLMQYVGLKCDKFSFFFELF